MNDKGSIFSAFKILYNRTIKESLNLPGKAAHKNIDTLMGVQSAKNLV